MYICSKDTEYKMGIQCHELLFMMEIMKMECKRMQRSAYLHQAIYFATYFILIKNTFMHKVPQSLCNVYMLFWPGHWWRYVLHCVP